MKIVVFHQYYVEPDLSGSTRMYHFVKRMVQAGHQVTVITGGAIRREMSTKLIVRTQSQNGAELISIADGYAQNKGFYGRLFSFFRYLCVATFIGLKYSGVDRIIASSTPLTVGVPALLVSKFRKVPLIFEVRDLWPDAPVALGYLKSRSVISLAHWFERLVYAKSQSIVALSNGIQKKIAKRTDTPVHFIPNGVDADYLEQQPVLETNSSSKIEFIYAGSCGFNNGMDTLSDFIIKAFDDPVLRECINVTIIGDGLGLEPYKNKIANKANLLGKLPKEEVVDRLFKADVGLYPQVKLNNNDLKKDSLPNKFFDYLGSGLCFLAAVDIEGEAAGIINENNLGRVCVSEDVESMLLAARFFVENRNELEGCKMASTGVREKYLRSDHADQFLKLIELDN